MTFRWRPSAGANRYYLWVSDHQGRWAHAGLQTTQTSLAATLSPGRYQWGVVAENSSGLSGRQDWTLHVEDVEACGQACPGPGRPACAAGTTCSTPAPAPTPPVATPAPVQADWVRLEVGREITRLKGTATAPTVVRSGKQFVEVVPDDSGGWMVQLPTEGLSDIAIGGRRSTLDDMLRNSNLSWGMADHLWSRESITSVEIGRTAAKPVISEKLPRLQLDAFEKDPDVKECRAYAGISRIGNKETFTLEMATMTRCAAKMSVKRQNLPGDKLHEQQRAKYEEAETVFIQEAQRLEEDARRLGQVGVSAKDAYFSERARLLNVTWSIPMTNLIESFALPKTEGKSIWQLLIEGLAKAAEKNARKTISGGIPDIPRPFGTQEAANPVPQERTMAQGQEVIAETSRATIHAKSRSGANLSWSLGSTGNRALGEAGEGLIRATGPFDAEIDPRGGVVFVNGGLKVDRPTTVPVEDGLLGLSGAPPVSAFEFHKAYPTPCDARRGESVKLEYSMPRDQEVELTIFSLFGAQVRQMSSGTGTTGGRAGLNTAVWDGSDDRGRKVSKGVYIAVLKAGGERVVAKLAIIH